MRERPALVLASASPRRRWLLSRLGLDFIAVGPGLEEELPPRAPHPERLARRLARAKALAVAGRYPGCPVLAADTVVVQRGQPLAKPRDAQEAMAMLRWLRGRWHRVVTAVALAWGQRLLLGHAITRVLMRRYGEEEIAAYVATGMPFDKAGAYGIQDEPFLPAAAYEGCYCNVVGLSLAVVIRLLDRAGLAAPEPTPDRLLPQCLSCPLLGDR